MPNSGLLLPGTLHLWDSPFVAFASNDVPAISHIRALLN